MAKQEEKNVNALLGELCHKKKKRWASASEYIENKKLFSSPFSDFVKRLKGSKDALPLKASVEYKHNLKNRLYGINLNIAAGRQGGQMQSTINTTFFLWILGANRPLIRFPL